MVGTPVRIVLNRFTVMERDCAPSLRRFVTLSGLTRARKSREIYENHLKNDHSDVSGSVDQYRTFWSSYSWRLLFCCHCGRIHPRDSRNLLHRCSMVFMSRTGLSAYEPRVVSVIERM